MSSVEVFTQHAKCKQKIVKHHYSNKRGLLWVIIRFLLAFGFHLIKADENCRLITKTVALQFTISKNAILQGNIPVPFVTTFSDGMGPIIFSLQ